jgi:antibiotic biosynthesis monooxygenase (ABM) superfamily enzyme
MAINQVTKVSTMHILSHIKHYLNQAGRDYFPEWFEQALTVLAEQPGMISVKYALDPTNSECIHLWVEFASAVNMKHWAQSSVKDQIVSALDCFRTQPYQVDRYELINCYRC